MFEIDNLACCCIMKLKQDRFFFIIFSQSMTLWEIYDAGTFYSICILSCFIAGEIFSLQLHVKKKDALAGHPSRFVQVKCKDANCCEVSLLFHAHVRI